MAATSGSNNSDEEAIQTLSLEEVTLNESQSPSPSKAKNGHHHSHHGKSGNHHHKDHKGHHHKEKKTSPKSSGAKSTSGSGGKKKDHSQSTTGYFQPSGAATDIIRSGHLEFDTLYASNASAVGRQEVTVNVCNAPNNSTIQCGCENINCPFCNLMLSIEKMDPSVLQ